MRKTLLFFSLFFVLLSASAQDWKLLRLYKSRQYCKAIERYSKIPSKNRTPEVLFIMASSYYELFKNPDVKCKLRDPLSRCLTTITRIKKSELSEAIEGLPELTNNAVSDAIQTYRLDMKRMKWDEALAMIERLKKIETNGSLLIDQASCEYGLDKASALETSFSALRLFADDAVKKDEAYFFDQTKNILINLDSTMNMDFHPLMDSLFDKFPNNEMLATAFYNHWKKDILKYSAANEYDFLFKTIKVILNHHSARRDWKDQMSEIVIALADSLTQGFLDNRENLSAYIQCCNFLMKARLTLDDIVPDLKNAKYYKVESMGKDFEITSFSFTSGITNKLKFSVNYNREVTYEINFDAVIPGVEMQNLKGITWKDAPKNKKAKNPLDIVMPETFNSLLLDTLTHFYCNEFRVQNNKAPLTWSGSIYRASKHHSMNMALLGSLFHGEEIDPLFGNPDSIGYYLQCLAPRNKIGGENILYGFWSKNISYDELAKKIIKVWEKSPGHRANMLHDRFSHASVSSTISNYSGQLAVFLDDTVAEKYYPELSKLFKVLPKLKNKSMEPNVSYFSSQNFNGE